MIVVLFDKKSNSYLVFEKNGIKNIDSKNFHLLKQIKNAIYITKAVEASGNQLFSMASKIFKQDIKKADLPPVPVNSPKTPVKQEAFYVHYVGRKATDKRKKVGGGISISDINLTFINPGDFKPLSSLKRIGFFESQMVKEYVDKGYLEIVPESKMLELRRQWHEENTREEEKIVNSIIIDTSKVKASEYAENAFSGGETRSKGDEYIEIDLDKGLNSRDISGGRYSNEGSLLPTDLDGE